MPIVPQNLVDEFYNDKTTNLSSEIQAAFLTDDSLKAKFSYAQTQEISMYIADQLGLPYMQLETDQDGVGKAGDIILFNSPQMIESAKAEMEKIWTDKTEGLRSYVDPSVLITAGSPGAGKTTLLYDKAPEQFGSDYILIDPDEETLMKMDMYRDLKGKAATLGITDPKIAEFLEKSGKSSEYFASMMSYTAYRWLSNGMSNTMQNRAVEAGYNIALGTTSTGGAVGKQIDAYYNAGYKIDYLVVDAHAETKLEANRIRLDRGNGKFVPMHDIVDKAEALSGNLPLFFSEKVNSTKVYWRETATSDAVLMAQIGPNGYAHNMPWLKSWLSMCYNLTLASIGLTERGQKQPTP